MGEILQHKVLESEVITASFSCSRTPDAKGSGGCKSHGHGFTALIIIRKTQAKHGRQHQLSVLSKSFAARPQQYMKQNILRHPSNPSFPSDILSLYSPQMGPSLANPLSSTSFLFLVAKPLPDVGLEEEGREKALLCG